jgi:glycosyltransferase involved in cell wall biosynthesis
VPRGRPYTIAFLLTSFDVGGTERQMVELIRRLDRRTFDVHIACFHRRGALEPLAAEHAASVATFAIGGFGRPSALRQLLAFSRWCRRIDASIVHTCELYSNIFGLPAAALARVPVRIGNRRELATADKTRAQLAAQRVAYKAAHAVVANSNAAADLLRREGVPAARVQLIRNGVDLEACGADRLRYTAAPVRRVITVANLRPEKGHDTLLEAAALVVARHPDAQFEIVGDGPLRATLERQVTTRGLGQRVRFLGERQDVPSLLASSDLFVLPSRSEACPNAVLEAMAAGLPIVACNVGGVPELIESGVTGMLVEPDAPERLANTVVSLMNEPGVAFDLGRAAREAACARFSFDRMVASFEHLYLTELHRRALVPEAPPELAAF